MNLAVADLYHSPASDWRELQVGVCEEAGAKSRARKDTRREP
jgi:hypothetical protein